MHIEFKALHKQIDDLEAENERLKRELDFESCRNHDAESMLHGIHKAKIKHLYTIIKRYDKLINGDGSKMGIYDCIDTYYSPCFKDEIKELNALIKQLDLEE